MTASYERAHRRVQNLKGFYSHAIVYVIVNIGLFVINAITSPGSWWFYWAVIGWGIGLLVHAGTVVFGGRFNTDWEERKIQRLMARDAHPPDERPA